MTEIKTYPYVRLTIRDRDNVVRRAIEESFAQRVADLKTVEDQVARAIYTDLLPAAEIRAANNLPKRWPKRVTKLTFNVSGLIISFDLLGDPVPVPYTAIDSNGRVGATSDPAHVDAVQSFSAAKADLAEDTSTAKASLKALVYSVNTLRDLALLWPEGAPFYDWLADRTGKPVAGLPAPQVAEINALLGLPKETKP